MTNTETPMTDQFGNEFRYKGKINVVGNPVGDDADRTIYDVYLRTAQNAPRAAR